ncbi:GNAT family N-acetyltransferase [Paenibacillus sp. GSMTC-2017]|uniref:GNAT family N-acetyltransferase n=1 Tax=Paenibacillus sp. GSMTC-2017 TaxID=2794350 RepID=UPI0018D69E4E|nr:GNAT family N-acetyltransferase [Paenibacillus sp. GSMTC-2017]MBH5317673.1 GNAT family N-acetyltransferase [Paenibacillus sp. GSMTC-2017]
MIRTFNKQDIDYVIESHCRIYNKEYNFDESFNSFIFDSVSSFLETYEPTKENVWLIDVDGETKGSIGIVKVSDETAQLRWFLIETDQRGKGYGKLLIQKSIDFCKANGYKTIILWTNHLFVSARKMYALFGFNIVETKTQFLSNQNVVEERWELQLG